MEASTAPDCALSGYVAISLADKRSFDDLGELRPEVFQYAGVWGEYIPLDFDVDDAMETALLQCTSATFEVTDSDTTWCVLKLSFLGEVVIADMWRAGKLRWSATKYRLELWTPIKSEWLSPETNASPRLEVIEAVLPQMYFDDWGDRVLSQQFWMQKSAQKSRCEECQNHHFFTWESERRFGGKRYCAQCWHAHCWSAGYIPGSLHGQTLKQQKAPTAFAADGPARPALRLQWPRATDREQPSP